MKSEKSDKPLPNEVQKQLMGITQGSNGFKEKLIIKSNQYRA